MEFGVPILSGIIGAVATWLLTPTPPQQDPQPFQRLDDAITAINRQVDSIKNLPIFEDTASNK